MFVSEEITEIMAKDIKNLNQKELREFERTLTVQDV